MVLYPLAVFVDKDIAPLARSERDGSAYYDKNLQIISFTGTMQLHSLMADGALDLVRVSNRLTPFASIYASRVFQKKQNLGNQSKIA